MKYEDPRVTEIRAWFRDSGIDVDGPHEHGAEAQGRFVVSWSSRTKPNVKGRKVGDSHLEAMTDAIEEARRQLNRP